MASGSSPKIKKPSDVLPPATEDIEITIIKNASFFDDPNVRTKVFANVKMTLAQLQKGVLYQKGVFFKKSKSSENLKQRFFYLTENGVFYAKDSAPELIIKHMPFENTRVIIIRREKQNERKRFASDFQFGFRFYRNANVCEIFCENQSMFQPWRSILMYKSIQHTFHEEFEVKKMIGRGSFAKVLKRDNFLQGIFDEKI
jgi:hypothetical protein